MSEKTKTARHNKFIFLLTLSVTSTPGLQLVFVVIGGDGCAVFCGAVAVEVIALGGGGCACLGAGEAACGVVGVGFEAKNSTTTPTEKALTATKFKA
jgi:hypothetical protein